MAGEVVVASAARTTSGQSAHVLCDGQNVDVQVDVSAAAGVSATLAIELEWSSDNGTSWATADPADSFATITAAGSKVETFEKKGDLFRVKWTIGGTTPSFTFKVTADFA